MLKTLDEIGNKYLASVQKSAYHLLRFALGIAFVIHGYQALPVPSQNLMAWFGFSATTATVVPIAAISSGLGIIISGFLPNSLGNLLTRLSALIIVVYMSSAFYIAHQDWFFTQALFTSEQIFLFTLGLFFLLKGNNTYNKAFQES